MAVDQNQPARALGGEMSRGGEADARCGTGDEDVTVREAAHAVPHSRIYAAALSIPSSPSLRYKVERPIPSRRATSVIRPR